MSQFIDRRKNGRHKSSVNRQKFLKRVKRHVKDSVKEMIRDGNIKDIVSDKTGNVNVPVRDISEPIIHHGEGGQNKRVYPGNKDFNEGDRIQRPDGGSGNGSGSGASNTGSGEDAFQFSITRDEFLSIFFEDLELPELVQKTLNVVEETKPRRAGYSNDGTPARLDFLHSMKQSVGRRLALRNPKKKKLKKLEEELKLLESDITNRQMNGQPYDIEQARKIEIEAEIVILKRKIRAIPFVDNNDLRYRQFVQEPVPIYKAVMFCVMDVSGSMGEWEKEMVKRFYMLLYLFLDRQYERIDLVFIRHHTDAKEVDEHDFFHSRETGGTIVSSALTLTADIIDERYPLNQWNIYVAQSSDGDNWGDDNILVNDLIRNRILPKVQYYFYIEVNQYPERTTDLWATMSGLKNDCDNFDIAQVSDVSEIYPVFRGLFKKRS